MEGGLENDVLGRAERRIVAKASRGCPFAAGAGAMHRVHGDGLNCARLRRSPADRLLVKGSAGKGRLLARLESTELIRRSGSLNPAKSERYRELSTCLPRHRRSRVNSPRGLRLISQIRRD